jgi:hypothetical protein
MTVTVWKGDLRKGSFVRRCDVPRELMDVARNFLITFENSKQQGEMKMATKKGMTTTKEDTISERTNMAFLAGIVKTVRLEDERAFFTLDTGQKQWVPCSVYKNDEVLRRLRGLADGDFIQLKAFIKPWSQKREDGEWSRGMNIEITEVKNIVKGNGVASRPATDDDIPF